VREYAYDRTSFVGKLNRGLDEAPKRGWTLVSMKNDWNRIFAFENEEHPALQGETGASVPIEAEPVAADVR